MSSLIIRPSKFGKALVIKTHKNAGGYILGFRLDPPELLEKVSTCQHQNLSYCCEATSLFFFKSVRSARPYSKSFKI